MLRRIVCTLLLGLVAMSLPCRAISTPRYQFTKISFSRPFHPRGMNNLGQVAGEVSNGPSGPPWHAAVWYPSGTIADLGKLSGGSDYSTAADINDNGQVAGYSQTSSGNRAFLWEYGSMLDLGTLGSGDSIGNALNGSGQVVGRSGVPHAFLWTAGTGMTDLGDLDSGTRSSEAYAVNDSGLLVGGSTGSPVNANDSVAFVWRQGAGMQTLGVLAGDNYSLAVDISNRGWAVGYSGSYGRAHAFVWQEGVGLTDLGALPGGLDYSSAQRVNELGQVFGWSRTPQGDHPFIWTQGEGMLDLTYLIDTPGLGTISIIDVDDRGRVLVSTGQGYGFLTPTPEPSGLLLLGSGILALAQMIRRKP